MTPVTIVNQMLPILTVIGQVVVLVLVVALLIAKKNASARKLLAFVGERALLFSFIVALIATAGSLFFSDVAGYEPCRLCWYQRIFMYPQVIIFGIATWGKQKAIATHAMTLSTAGAAIAAFHYYGQIWNPGFLSCGVVGYSVSCAQRFIMEFGYITIPMMSLTAFLMIIVFLLAKKKAEQV